MTGHARSSAGSAARAWASAALVLAASELAACSPAVDARREEGGLWTRLLRAEGIDLIAFDAQLDRVAARCVERWEESGPLDVRYTRVLAGEAPPRDADRARIVAGGPEDSAARDLALHLGVVGGDDAGAPGSAGFQVAGRRFAEPWDGLLATFEDPERPGLPVTLLYAEGSACLGDLLERCQPASRTRLWVFQQGRLAADADLELDGRLIERSLRRYEPSWIEEARTYREVSSDGAKLSARAAPDVPPGRAGRYLDACTAARARVGGWTGVEPRGPVVLLEAGVERHAALGARGREGALARSHPELARVHVLLAPGMVDDGGAALAELAYRDAWGAPVREWMAAAAGVEAAGEWWGRPLEQWRAAFALCERPPDFEDLFGARAAERVSPHVRLPGQALVLRALRERLGTEALGEVWRGVRELERETLVHAFREAFSSFDAAARDELLARREAQRARSLEPGRAWRGFHLAAPSDASFAGYGSSAASRSLTKMVKLGAGAVALGSLYAVQPGPWTGLAFEAQPRSGCLEGDAALAATLAEARARGLSTMLVPELLTSPSGGIYGDAHLTSPDDWRAFFAAYEAFVTHYALLADLVGVDLLCIGAGMPAATRVSQGARGRAEIEESLAVREEGWARVIRRARQLYSGALTFSAESELQAGQIGFWEALDWIGVELAPGLGEGSGVDGRADRLRARFEALLAQGFARLTETFGKPCLVTRVGFRSVQGAAGGGIAGGSAAGTLAAADPLMQARLYEALAGALASASQAGNAPRGLFLRSWMLGAEGMADRGYGPRGKPAEELLPRLFGR